MIGFTARQRGLKWGGPQMMYLMKTVQADGSAWGGFVWPLEVGAEVVAPDWDPEPRCGGGLHGLLNGQGDGAMLSWEDDAVWIAAEIPDGDPIVDLSGKVKVRRCIVSAAGGRAAVTAWLAARGCGSVVGAALTGGNGATLTGGNRAIITGGDGATLTGGDHAALIFRHAGGCAVAVVGQGGIKPHVAYTYLRGQIVPAGDA